MVEWRLICALMVYFLLHEKTMQLTRGVYKIVHKSDLGLHLAASSQRPFTANVRIFWLERTLLYQIVCLLVFPFFF